MGNNSNFIPNYIYLCSAAGNHSELYGRLRKRVWEQKRVCEKHETNKCIVQLGRLTRLSASLMDTTMLTRWGHKLIELLAR